MKRNQSTTHIHITKRWTYLLKTIRKIQSLTVCCFLFASCGTYKKDAYELLDNKTIVYSEYVIKDGKVSNYTYNSFYIDYRDKALYWIDDSLGTEDWALDSYRTFPPYSYLPFRYFKEKNKVYIFFLSKDSTVKFLHYSLEKFDTTSIRRTNAHCFAETNSPYVKRKSVYTGRDTSIYFNNFKFKCRVFEEYYFQARPAPWVKEIKYLEKNTFVPILITTVYFDNDLNKQRGRPLYNMISFLVDNRNYSSPFWRLSDCVPK